MSLRECTHFVYHGGRKEQEALTAQSLRKASEEVIMSQQSSYAARQPDMIRPAHDHTDLPGKVILLIGKDPYLLTELVIKLLWRKALCAVVCPPLPARCRVKMEQVSSQSGTRLLMLQKTDVGLTTVDGVIEQVVACWGHLDAFIDLTQAPRTSECQSPGHPATVRNQPLACLTRSLLEEIALH